MFTSSSKLTKKHLEVTTVLLLLYSTTHEHFKRPTLTTYAKIHHFTWAYFISMFSRGILKLSIFR